MFKELVEKAIINFLSEGIPSAEHEGRDRVTRGSMQRVVRSGHAFHSPSTGKYRDANGKEVAHTHNDLVYAEPAFIKKHSITVSTNAH